MWLAAVLLLTLAPSIASAATPAFSVHKNGTNQTVTADTDVKLTWSTEGFDTNSNFATDRFTPTVAGKYLIVLSAHCAQAGACMPSIYKNGVLLARSQATNFNIGQTPQATALVDLNGSTDYVEAFINSAGTVINGIANLTYFSGMQLDAAGAGGASQWVNDTGGAIYYSGGKVGIGTTPTRFFHVLENGVDDSQIALIGGGSGAGGASVRIGANDTTANIDAVNTGVDALVPLTMNATTMALYTNNGPRVYLDGTGNVGIGITNPNAKLSVSSTWGPLTLSAASTTFNTMAGALGTTATNELSLASIGFTSANQSSLGIRAYRASAGSDWTTTAIGLGMDVDNSVRVNSSGIWLHANGNVGIGTTGPTQKLQVNGWMRTTDGTVDGVLAPVAADSTLYLVSTSNHSLCFGTNNVWCRMKLDNSGNVGIGNTNPTTNKLTVGGQSGQSNANVAARAGNANSFEWGHANTAGYGSTLGYHMGNGAPFLAFNSEAGATNNTFMTRGLKGSVLKSDNGGGFIFSTVSNTSADNQTPTDIVSISSGGNFSFSGIATGNGSGLTNLNASNLASGTVATARLGGGTANSSTYLRGDGTWATPGGGGAISMQMTPNTSAPAACAAGNDGTVAVTAAYTWCVCRNGTGWVSMNDGLTACAWVIHTIVTNGASRNWSDSTYATSCNGYRNPSGNYVYGGATGSGLYTVSVSGTPTTVYCDMTNNGGGWTLLASAYGGSNPGTGWSTSTSGYNASSPSITATFRLTDAQINALKGSVGRYTKTSGTSAIFFSTSALTWTTGAGSSVNGNVCTDPGLTTGCSMRTYVDGNTGNWTVFSAWGDTYTATPVGYGSCLNQFGMTNLQCNFPWHAAGNNLFLWAR